MTRSAAASAPLRVSVGICAFNEAARVGCLLESLLTQPVPAMFELEEVLGVASGCTDGTEGVIREVAAADARVHLIHEAERRGKASALNRILERYRGDILFLVNADARLAPGSLANLLQPFGEHPEVRIACGAAVPEPERGIPHTVEQVLWDLHNRLLAVQSTGKLGNHCCDEFMAIRRGFVDSLPRDLINDGAYLGVLAALAGQTVRFCEDACVWVRTPRSVRGLLQRRRRILRGHRQVRRVLGASPHTLESLDTRNPGLASWTVARGILDHPAALPILLHLAAP